MAENEKVTHRVFQKYYSYYLLPIGYYIIKYFIDDSFIY